MRKYPKKKFEAGSGLLIRGIKAVLILETACIVGAYYYWRKLFNSQEYRYEWHQNHPHLLNLYYMSIKPMSELQQQKEDYAKWNVTES